ncbi:hypothetical protein IFT82_14905 [Sphingomonas sp. CFBP 8760]|nr:hypothetical protein [Sphingomonas sp. CFBP 8760]
MLIYLSPEDVAHFAERERQRFDHLVIGRPRPAPDLPKRPEGLSKMEWKVEKQRLREQGRELLPGIEEWVQLREDWSHKQGTPETHAHAARPGRPGAMARLLASGTIDGDQSDAAEEIAACFWLIAADVTVRTANLEPQIRADAHGQVEREKLGRIMIELAYTAWRASLRGYGDALLAVIVHDEPLTVVARRHGLGMIKARRLLCQALDLWWVARASIRREVRERAAA